MNIERRYLHSDAEESVDPVLAVESRGEGDQASEWIVGYAAKFNVLSLDLGDFVERLDPGAFALVAERRGRKRPLETRSLWNHDPNFPLARYPRTLSLRVDAIGLRYEHPVPDTSYGRDLAANIRAGIVVGSSFSFSVREQDEKWSVEEGRSVRTIMKVEDLLDVSPVTFPAYPAADVQVAKRSYSRFVMRAESRGVRIDRAAAHREFLKSYGNIQR